MRLPRNGREYAIFTFEDLSAADYLEGATVEAELAGSDVWHPVTMEDATQVSPGKWSQQGKLLVRGPSTTGDGVLVAATSAVRIRVVDTPEEIYRPAGTIRLVDA